MRRTSRILRSLHHDPRGVLMAEYVVLLALVSFVALGAFTKLAPVMFDEVAAAVDAFRWLPLC